jgi:hypothetical protein
MCEKIDHVMAHWPFASCRSGAFPRFPHVAGCGDVGLGISRGYSALWGSGQSRIISRCRDLGSDGMGTEKYLENYSIIAAKTCVEILRGNPNLGDSSS